MKKHLFVAAACLLTLTFCPLFSVQADSEEAQPVSSSVADTERPASDSGAGQPSADSDSAASPSSASDDVDAMVDGMTTRQKITQMLMPDFRKWQQEGQEAPTDLTEMNDEVADAIDRYDFGGVILFAENVKETEQTLALTQAMQQAAIRNKADNGKIPLFLAIDQEGGIVYRLGSGTALPGNMALGATGSPELANQAGQIIGRELSALGLNVDFAPVLDTNNNPQNPIIGLRSFSSDPSLVARLGIPMMQGIQQYQVAVAAKHFPGHGDTAVDSHTGLPLVDKSYAELEQLELLPFKKAMDQDVDMVMTAHIQYPQIEKDTVVSKESGETIYLPATLSDDVITGIVRQKFGYKGVVVSDAMGMDAIAKNFGESEAAIMAIKAGVDIVLMPTTLRSKADLAKVDQIISDIEDAVKRGELPESRLDESVSRILRLKSKRGILSFSLSDRTADKAKATVGSEQNRETERTIAAKAVTVVKNEDTVLPFKVKSGDRILLLGAYDNELPGLELGIKRLMADGVIPSGVSFESLRYSSTTTIDELKGRIDNASHVIVISEIGREAQLAADMWLTKIPTDLVRYANESGKQAVVMSISKPYDVANYPEAKAVVAVYGNKGMDPTESLKPDNAFGPNIPAGVEVIFNGREHQGRLPVAIPAVHDGLLSETETAYPLGHGLMYTDPVKDIGLTAPRQSRVGDTFTVRLTLGNLQGLDKSPYQLVLTVDRQHFSPLVKDGYETAGDTVTIPKQAGDRDPVELEFRALSPGRYAPLSSLTLVDSQDRRFSMGEQYYGSVQVQVEPASESRKDEQKGWLPPASGQETSTQSLLSVSQILGQSAGGQHSLPRTGEKQQSPLFAAVLLILGAGCLLRKKQQ